MKAEDFITLGVGCSHNAAADELLALAQQVLRSGGVTVAALACIATIESKRDEPAMHALAQTLGAPLRLFAPEVLDRETHRVTDPSDVVFRTMGTHSIAEASALAAAGEDASLIVVKCKSAHCTAALAISTSRKTGPRA